MLIGRCVQNQNGNFGSQTFQHRLSHPSLATTIERDHDNAKNSASASLSAPCVAAIAPAVRSEAVNRIVGAVVPHARTPAKLSRDSGVVDLVTTNVSQRRVIGHYPQRIIISNRPAPALSKTYSTDPKHTIQPTATTDCSSVVSSHTDEPLDYSMKTLRRLEQAPAIENKLTDSIVGSTILFSSDLLSVAQNTHLLPNDFIACSKPGYVTTSPYSERNAITDTSNLDTLCEVALSSRPTLTQKPALDTTHTSIKPESLTSGNVTELLHVEGQVISDLPERQSVENVLPRESKSCEPVELEANNVVVSSEENSPDADKSTDDHLNQAAVECNEPDLEVAATIKTEFKEVPFLPRFSCHSPIDLNEACCDEYDNLCADMESVPESKRMSHTNGANQKSPALKLDSRASRTARRADRESPNERAAKFEGKVCDQSPLKQETIVDESPNKRNLLKLGYRVHSEYEDGVSRVKRRKLVRKRNMPVSDTLKSKAIAKRHSDSSGEEDGEFFKTDIVKKQVKNNEKSQECLKWTSPKILIDRKSRPYFRSPSTSVSRSDFSPTLCPTRNNLLLNNSIETKQETFDDLNESSTFDKKENSIRLKSFVRSADDDVLEMSFDDDTDDENIPVPTVVDDATVTSQSVLSEEIRPRTAVVCLGRVRAQQEDDLCAGGVTTPGSKNARIRGCWKSLDFVGECLEAPSYFQKVRLTYCL